MSAQPLYPCWFCGREVRLDYLIAGYDTFEEQRLACLDCDRTISALREKGWLIAARAQQEGGALREALDAAERVYQAISALTAGDKSLGEEYVLAWVELGDALQNARTALAAQPATDLDAAWREAEKVLPEHWHIYGVHAASLGSDHDGGSARPATDIGDDQPRWWQSAARGQDVSRWQTGQGSDPAAALLDLAAHLRVAADEAADDGEIVRGTPQDGH